MRNVCFFFALVCAFGSWSWACVGPSNIEGVAFTSGETINVQTLMNMGVENVNYVKEGDAPNIGIRYKSHYDTRAMVFIGNYGLSFQQNVRMDCMGVVLPLADSPNVSLTIEKTTFNFAAAVKTELAWLASKGIVDLTAQRIAHIDSILSISTNGGTQYWTHAKTVLGYNSWYGYDSVSGKWIENGVNGVREVKGVNEVQGCSVVKPGSGVPPASLGTTAALSKTTPVSAGTRSCAVRQSGNGGLIVFLPHVVHSGVVLVVTDLKGAAVRTKKVPAGVGSMYLNGLAVGRYTARLIH
jgi:hypothetical protein